jgi:RHS repeat-associated protein
MYYYVKNIQGDIVKIIDENGTEVAGYVYDAWGNTLTTTGDTTLGSLNPLRYRGYVYDTDTGLYYLQSRYYDPFTGRFLNADDTYVLQLSDSEILSTNLYTYCGNNPINNTDPEGNWGLPTPAKLIAAALIGGLIGAACEAIIQIMLEHKSLKTLKWGSIAIEFVSGALTGVLIACNFPASLTNLGRGVINMLTSLAHSIKKGSFKSISGAFKAIGSAILSGIITIVIGSIRTTRGKTLNYTTVKNMIKKIGLNRVARGGFRFGIGWFTIKFA